MVNTIFRESGLSYSNLRDYIDSENIGIVLVGDVHDPGIDHEIQGNVLEAIRPDYYLHEFLEDSDYLSQTEIKNVLEHPTKHDPNTAYIFRLAQRHGTKLIGCDLKGQGMDYLDEAPEEEIAEWTKRNPDDDGLGFINVLREKKMGNMAKRYHRKSGSPVVEAVGAYHLIDSSSIYQVLKGNNVYMIYPSFHKSDRIQTRRLRETETFRGKHLKL